MMSHEFSLCLIVSQHFRHSEFLVRLYYLEKRIIGTGNRRSISRLEESIIECNASGCKMT